MRNNILRKYRYFVFTSLDVSEFWEPTVITMIKDIDKHIKPKLIPRFVINMMYDLGYAGKKGNRYWQQMLSSFTSGTTISQIKSKFATLRVYGDFNSDVRNIVKIAEDSCNNICESCGAVGASHTVIKGWVTNLCPACKEKNSKK